MKYYTSTTEFKRLRQALRRLKTAELIPGWRAFVPHPRGTSDEIKRSQNADLLAKP